MESSFNEERMMVSRSKASLSAGYTFMSESMRAKVNSENGGNA